MRERMTTFYLIKLLDLLIELLAVDGGHVYLAGHVLDLLLGGGGGVERAGVGPTCSWALDFSSCTRRQFMLSTVTSHSARRA